MGRTVVVPAPDFISLADIMIPNTFTRFIPLPIKMDPVTAADSV